MFEQYAGVLENKVDSSTFYSVNQFTLENQLIHNNFRNYYKFQNISEFDNIEYENIVKNVFPMKDINSSEIIEIVNNKNHMDNDICIEISEEKKNISFLCKKTERTTFDNIIQKKVDREDNHRIKIGTNFFNTYLKNRIENIKKAFGCKFCLYNFPKAFIRELIKKSKRIYLDYSLERLLEDEELYKNKDSEGYYSKNLKIINEIKSGKNKDIMEKNGYNKILKMKYKELFEEYLNSDEFKKKIEQLNSKNKKAAENFVYCSNSFIKRFL